MKKHHNHRRIRNPVQLLQRRPHLTHRTRHPTLRHNPPPPQRLHITTIPNPHHITHHSPHNLIIATILHQPLTLPVPRRRQQSPQTTNTIPPEHPIRLHKTIKIHHRPITTPRLPHLRQQIQRVITTTTSVIPHPSIPLLIRPRHQMRILDMLNDITRLLNSFMRHNKPFQKKTIKHNQNTTKPCQTLPNTTKPPPSPKNTPLN